MYIVVYCKFVYEVGYILGMYELYLVGLILGKFFNVLLKEFWYFFLDEE